MKKIILLFALLCVTMESYCQTGVIVLNVQQIQSTMGGEISAGIFRKENFPKVGSFGSVAFAFLPHWCSLFFQGFPLNKSLELTPGTSQ